MTHEDPISPRQRRLRAGSFGPAAQLYDRVRPPYPAEAVAWALEPLDNEGSMPAGVETRNTGRPGPHRVADIGAGTGIMTRLLVSLGHDVVAVEPDEQMRQQLAGTVDVEALAGGAEAMPLPTASIDAAVAAHAYHWFDHDRAHAELGRVIRPGGVFAAIWNDRDESVAWVNAYTHIVGSERGAATHPPASFGELFGNVEYAEFRHITSHTPDTLVALLQSRSYYLTATPDRQATLAREVRDLTASHPDLAGRTEFDLPYRTVVYRATHS